MVFSAFDTKKTDEYAAQAKAAWGDTPAYKEYETKNRDRTQTQQQDILKGMAEIFAAFGAIRTQSPESDAAQALVKRLQDYITAHFYTCTDQILAGLGEMYGCGGAFTQNINAAAGEGTAEFAAAAIRYCCR